MNITYCKQQIERMSQYKRVEDIVNYINASEKQQIITLADQLLQHIFTFDKPWDMERCVIPYQVEPLDWNAQRNDDEEWCFMLNRMDYLSDFMLAGYLCDDDRYIIKGKTMILDFIEKHTEMKPEPSTRTLDTGIRLMNMMETLPYIYKRGLLSDQELTTIIEHFQTSFAYLKEKYLTKYILSNWGSIQMCAIISILPLYEANYHTDEMYCWAKQELETQFSIQVYPDGMQWEQSTMYHIEVLNYGMKALYYQRFYGDDELVICKAQVEKLMQALYAQMTPRNEIETFGDSDRVNILDVCCRGAVLFSNGQWKYQGLEQFDVESLYSFGCNEGDAYETLETIHQDVLIFDGVDSGMYTIKSSMQKDANFTMFTNGSLGSGHGHSDNLHVSLYYQGVPVCIDPGRYTYREDHPLRVQLKSMQAHNCVLIDQHAYCLPSDSWGYHDFGLPLKNYVRHVDGIHYLEGSLVGHEPLSIWTRKVVVLDQGIWLIMDEVKADGEHEMTSYLHLDPKIKTKRTETGMRLEGDITLCMMSEGEYNIQEQPCSLRYNELMNHEVITSTKKFQDHGEHVTCFFPQHVKVEAVDILQNNQTVVAKDVAQAYRFILSKEEQYTIAIFHKEIFKGKKICYCDGMPFHGKCVVVHTLHGQKTLTLLRA